MKPQNAKRVAALETALNPLPPRIIHQFFWLDGQSFGEALDANKGEEWDVADSVIVHLGVAAKDGRPVPDPIRERDTEVADAWFERFASLRS